MTPQKTPDSPNRNEYDVIVIGAGPVGENIADYVRRGGLRPVIIEAELVGGECSYWACMPSKALLRGITARSAALRVAGAAQSVTGPLDIAALLGRRDGFTSRGDDAGQVSWLEGAGIDLIRGRGRLSGVREVTVTAADGSRTVLTARRAVAVATGSVPVIPEIPGLAEARPWTNREALSLTSVPESVIILGGGVVATELATIYRGLGSAVTVIARSGILAAQPEFAREAVVEALTESGVRIIRDSPTRVERTGGTVNVLVAGETHTATEIIVATGRRPATADLGLERLGLRPGDPIYVDDEMLAEDCNEEWFYAAGDVNGRAPLTHQGKYQARVAAASILARAAGTLPVPNPAFSDTAATADHVAIPAVIFSDPEIAHVGLTAEEAGDRGLSVREVDFDLGAVAGAALIADGYRGHARITVDEDREVILGAHLVGQDVAELLHAFTIAVVGEVPLDRLWHAVPAYPTMSEIWLRLIDTYREDTTA